MVLAEDVINMDGWSQFVGGSFIIGAIFWAGATYSRISRIEKDLVGLVDQLKALSEMALIKAQIKLHGEEIVMLRKSVYGSEWRQHGGPREGRNDE